MKSTSMIKRLLAFAIAFTMVMSAASVAFADGFPQNAFTNSRLKDIQIEDIEAGSQQAAAAYQVSFMVGGEKVSAQLVPEGGHAIEPAAPEIPEGFNSFLGWYTAQTDGAAFNFEGTAVTQAITLYARFSTNYLVKFYDAQWKVIHSVEVAPNGTVTAPSNPTPPPKTVFREWRVVENGVLSDSAYVFSTKVDHNFTLAPYFANTHYVYFISRGTPVSPQVVVSGELVVQPAPPTRVGYIFQHWSLTDGGDAYNFTTPVAADTTLYAVWEAKTVNYTVVYWVEKPNIADDPGEDPANYMFGKSETRQGPAGSEITAEDVQNPTVAFTSNDGALYYAQYSHGSTITVAGNGTSVINVYYKRIVYTLNFNLGQRADTEDHDYAYRNHKATMTIDGVTYTYPETYSITAKYEQKISAVWPTSPTATFSQTADIWKKVKSGKDWVWQDTGNDRTYYFAKWDNPFGGSDWVTRRITLTSDMIPTNRLTTTSYTIKAIWITDGEVKSVNYWFEQLPGQSGTTDTYGSKTYVKSTEYSQTYFSNDDLSAKTITGMNYIGSKDPKYNFYYDRLRYILSFDSQGGSAVASVPDVMYEQPLGTLTLPSDPTRQNYTFQGWYYEADYRTKVDFSKDIMPNNNLGLFAKWESSKYTVRFYNGVGGSELAELQEGKADNEYVAEPTIYEKGKFYEGFGEFIGWYWYLPGTTYLVAYSWETPVTGNLDLYAMWKMDGFKLTYNAGAGTGAVPVDDDEYDLNVLAPVQNGSGLVANDSGKKFVGWKIDGAGATYYTGSTVKMAGNITLVAFYANVTDATKITFDPNFETEQEPVVWDVLNNDTVALAGAGIFTRDKYTIVGWSDTLGGEVADYTLNQAYTVAGEKTFYAVWARSNVSVQFLSDTGGTLSGTPLWSNLPYNTAWTSITVPTPMPAANYAFVGWYWNNGTGPKVDETNPFPATITDDLVYVAKWKPIEVQNVYTVHYHTNPGGSDVSWPADISKAASSEQTLTAATKVGAAFSGWRLNDAGEGAAITALDANDYVQNVTPISQVEGETNVVWTYEWVADVYGTFADLSDEVNNYYTVVYKLDGGAAETAYTDETVMPTGVRADASQQGYTFTGWYKEGDGAKTKLTALTQDNYDKDAERSNEIPAAPGKAKVVNNYYTLTLVGEFTKNIHKVSTYEITYKVTDTVGGLEVADAAFKAGKSVTGSGTTALAMPVPKSGYTISGTWTIAGGGIANQSIAGGAAFVWGNPTVTTSDAATYKGEDGKLYFVETSAYTLAATALVAEDRGAPLNRYQLTYTIDGTYYDLSNNNAVIPVTAPGKLTQDSKPTAIAEGPSVKGHSFNGWKQTQDGASVGVVATTIEWTASGTVDEVIGGKLVAVTTYTATIVGTYTPKTATENYYQLTYSGTDADKTLAGTNWPTDIPYGTAQATPPAVADALSVNGYTFNGWTGAAWAKDEEMSGIVYENDTFVTKNYYSKTVTGAFEKNIHKISTYEITYKVTDTVGGLEDADAAFKAGKSVTGSGTTALAMPVPKSGYTISGTWTIAGGGIANQSIAGGAAFVWGNPTVTLGGAPTYSSGGKLYFVETSAYTLAATAVVAEDRGEAVTEYYLSYTVDAGPYYNPITNANDLALTGMPANITKGAAPTAIGSAPSVQGYTFSGWKQGETAVTEVSHIVWQSVTKDEVRNGKLVSVTTMTAALEGSFAIKEATEENYYQLTYSGTDADKTLAGTNWPADIPYGTAQATPPAVAGALSVNGYTFNGWNGADWALDETKSGIVYENDTFVTKNYYSKTVTGAFAKNTLNTYAYTITYTVTGKTAEGLSDPTKITWQQTGAASFNADALPGLKSGYKITGWTIGGATVAGGAALPWALDAGSGIEETTPTFIDGTWYFVTPHIYTLEATAVVARNDVTLPTQYVIEYSVTGDENPSVLAPYSAKTVGSSTAHSLQALPAANPGYTIAGWTVGGTHYGQSDTLPWANAVITYPAVLDGGVYKVTPTCTLQAQAVVSAVTAQVKYVYTLTYQLDKAYTDAAGNTLTATGMPDPLSETFTFTTAEHTQPTVSPGAPSMDGHTFAGWSTLNWGTPVETTATDPGTNAVIHVYTYTASVTGSFTPKAIVEENYYTLTYTIVGGPYHHGDGTTVLTPSAPAGVSDQMLAAGPTLAAGNPLDGHTFNGWMQGETPVAVGAAPAYAQVGQTEYTQNDQGQFVVTKYFSAAVTGSYTTNGLDEVVNWTLTYTGSSALANPGTWPASPVTATGAGNEPKLTTLVPAKEGYTFSGWSTLAWTPSVAYTLVDNKYVKTTTNTATVNGTLEKDGTIDEYIYIVTYSIGGAGGTYNLDETKRQYNDEIAEANLPTIAAPLAETDKVFSGWDPTTLNWGSATAVTKTDARYDATEKKWVTTHTKTIAVTGSFTTITDENVTRYSLDYTGPGYATLPSNIVKDDSKPAFPGTPGAPDNYRFDGWYQNDAQVSEIAWSEPVKDGEPVLSGTVRTQYYLSTATLEARFVETGEHHTYTLHYEVTGTIGSEQNPIADDVSTSGKIKPASSKVAATIDEYSFTGWSITSDWTTVQGETKTVEGVEVTYYTHEATATGSYAQIVGEEQRSLYNVIYTGPAGASPWPDNVTNAGGWPDPMPTNVAPYLSGYNFTGWVLVEEDVKTIRTVEEVAYTPQLSSGDEGAQSPDSLEGIESPGVEGAGENGGEGADGGVESLGAEGNVESLGAEGNGENGEGDGDNGGEQPKRYIVVVTTVYTNTYRATFSEIGGGGGEPIEPEIPLGVPHTGGDDLSGLAAILAISGMAVMTGTVLRRRRDEAEESE